MVGSILLVILLGILIVAISLILFVLSNSFIFITAAIILTLVLSVCILVLIRWHVSRRSERVLNVVGKKDLEKFEEGISKSMQSLKEELKKEEKSVDEVKKELSKIGGKVTDKVKKVKKRYHHRFIASKVSNKYHTFDCHWGNAIDPEDQIFFKTRREAKIKGYKACSNCIVGSNF